MKKKYGSAFSPLDKMDDTRTYPIHDDRIVEAKQLNKIVEARMMEIISNVWFQIGEGIVYEKLLAGVVITGGGANMSDLQLAFTDRTKFEKLIPMRFVDFTVKGNQPEIEAKDGCMNTVLGILYKGEVNCCAGDLIVTTGDLFTDESEDTHGKAPVCDAQTKVEKESQEQEAKRKALAEENERKATEEAERLAAEEKIRLEEERKEKERIRQDKREAWKKNNICSRTGTALKNFSKRMIDED